MEQYCALRQLQVLHVGLESEIMTLNMLYRKYLQWLSVLILHMLHKTLNDETQILSESLESNPPLISHDWLGISGSDVQYITK